MRVQEVIDSKDAIGYTVGGAALFNPVYLSYLETVWQAGIAIGGAVIIYLTIQNKLLDHRIKKLTIKELEEELENKG